MSKDAENVAGLYERNALRWDSARRGGPFLEIGWLDRMCSTLSLGSAILDIGCGGADPVGRYLIGRGFRLTGIDTSIRMVNLCRHRFPEQEWILGDMRGMSLRRQFPALVAWDSFFHLSRYHQRRMFGIFKQLAAPGAALLFNTGSEDGEAIGSFEGEPLYHASLGTSEYEHLLAATGFSVTAHVENDSSCGGRTVWLARRVDSEAS